MNKMATREKRTSNRKAPSRKAAAVKPVVEEVENPLAAPDPDVVVCVHRWRIESPNGATSHGVCKHCGEERDFPNSAEDGLWEREVPQSRWTGRSEWRPSEGGGY
jgi:hypothetical protein